MAAPEPPKDSPTPVLGKTISPAAERALAEAEARRVEIDRRAAAHRGETGRKNGPEPTRYGDWEKKGIASDF